MYEIYIITNAINGKQYVGLTKQGIARRFYEHMNNKQNHVSALGNAVARYGKDSFLIETVANCETLDEAYRLERMGIAYFNTLSPNGYNIHIGGTGGKMTEEMKKKISESKKGKYTKEEYHMYG